jgi:hypothetical protein
LLPRDWDGRRLLRFLTGLAMLALAFTAPAPAMPATEPAPVATVVAAANETSVTLSESESETVRVPAAPVLPADLPLLVLASLTVLLLGLAQRVRTTRAPPAV